MQKKLLLKFYKHPYKEIELNKRRKKSEKYVRQVFPLSSDLFNIFIKETVKINDKTVYSIGHPEDSVSNGFRKKN